MEGLEVVLEVVEVVPSVVVGDDKVDLAAGALGDELLEPVGALVGFLGIGDSGRADADVLLGEGLDELLVGCDSGGNIHFGTSATGLVGLVEAQDVRDLVLLLGSGEVGGPALSAPLLVGMEQGNVFDVNGLAINDRLPVVHPGDLIRARKLFGVRRSSNTIVLLGKGKTALASTTCLERYGISEGGEPSKGQKKGGLEHVGGVRNVGEGEGSCKRVWGQRCQRRDWVDKKNPLAIPQGLLMVLGN